MVTIFVFSVLPNKIAIFHSRRIALWDLKSTPLDNIGGTRKGEERLLQQNFTTFNIMFSRKKKPPRPQEGKKKNDLSNLVLYITLLVSLDCLHRQKCSRRAGVEMNFDMTHIINFLI